MTIHELYGLQVEKLEAEITEHMKTIGVLQQLKAGTLRLDQVEVSERGWKVILSPELVKEPGEAA